MTNKNWTEAHITNRPACDFCHQPAEYDGKTKLGPWAYMCQKCFAIFGVGLGLGKGQQLIITGG